MPCYSTIQTELKDLNSIMDAARKLGYAVNKINDNAVTVSNPRGSITLVRNDVKDKFRSSSKSGDYETILDELIPAYAVVQLKRFAKANGYTISQGDTAQDFNLVKFS